MEDWALIRRLAAEGVPKAAIARRLGVSRNTVIKAVASNGPPKYERRTGPTSFTPYEARVRQLLAETPDMPATVLAERVGWTGSIRWFSGQRQPAAGRPSPDRPGRPADVDGRGRGPVRPVVLAAKDPARGRLAGTAAGASDDVWLLPLHPREDATTAAGWPPS